MATQLTLDQMAQFYGKAESDAKLKSAEPISVNSCAFSDLSQMMTHKSGNIKIVKKINEAKIVSLKPTQESE